MLTYLFPKIKFESLKKIIAGLNVLNIIKTLLSWKKWFVLLSTHFLLKFFKFEYITETTLKLTLTFWRSVREEKILFLDSIKPYEVLQTKLLPSEDFLSRQPHKSLTQPITPSDGNYMLQWIRSLENFFKLNWTRYFVHPCI